MFKRTAQISTEFLVREGVLLRCCKDTKLISAEDWTLCRHTQTDDSTAL